MFWFLYEKKKMIIENTDVFFTKLFMGNWASLESIFWFLPALFSLNFFFFLFFKNNRITKSTLIVDSFLMFVFANHIMSFHNLMPFGLDVALYIFILAYLIRLIYENKNWIKNLNLLMLIVAIIISSLLLFYFEPIKMHTQWHSRIDLAQFFVPVTVIGYVSFIVINLSIFTLFLKIKPNRVLEFIGTYSFPIFIMHLIILYNLPLRIKLDTTILNLLFMVLTFMLAIVLPIFLSKVLMKLSDKFKYIGLVK